MTDPIHFDATIQPWGNSLGLRITQPMSRLAHLTRGTRVSVEVTGDGLLIRPLKEEPRGLKLRFSEEELLQGMTPYKAHADELATPSGKEMGDE